MKSINSQVRAFLLLIASVAVIGCSANNPIESVQSDTKAGMGLDIGSEPTATSIVGNVSAIDLDHKIIELSNPETVILVDENTAIRYNNRIQSRNGDLSMIKKGDGIKAVGTQISKKEFKAEELEIYTSSRINSLNQ